MKTITTYSMWRTFRDCRRKCQWRYIDQLVPRDRDTAMYLGSAVHEALAKWYETGGGNRAAPMSVIDAAYYATAETDRQLRDATHANTMIAAYLDRYPREDWQTLAIEQQFTGEIINPATGKPSQSFVLAGKVDGIVRRDNGGLWLLEHKTTASIDGGYIERLWCDSQIHLYALYIGQHYGEPVEGVVYNLLAKPRIRRGKHETWCQYRERCAEWYATGEAFHRELVLIDPDALREEQEQLWELTQSYLDARRRGAWYANTSQCFVYGKPCPYWALCRSRNNLGVRENLYEHKQAHSELDTVDSTGDEPVF